jgi:3-isopropylmalate/(R)-2-methylmalate dehydratase small subunit
MEPLVTVASHVVLLPRDNIDTDQITPARFLRTTTKTGMRDVLFADWRRDPDFVLNRPESATSRILVAGDNFGCGSSREHAPWALADWGFRVVIASSFADIFKSNCIKNGILPCCLEPATLAALTAALSAAPHVVVAVDVRTCNLTVDGAPFASFPLDPFAQRCLLEGLDELGYILAHEAAIAAHESGETV